MRTSLHELYSVRLFVFDWYANACNILHMKIREEYIELHAEIQKFCKEFNMKEVSFGRPATSDGRFVERMEAGAWFRPEKIQRAKNYMAERRLALDEANARNVAE